MASTDAVWAIDVGQCALKALRCRPHESSKLVVADAFDYIEYPKILSQPGSEPAELIADALKQFLSRNTVKGDRVAISVSGQAGLARFIKLPPVEAKKIPDIVRYEAKQQIPFDLNDVIWDYQRMGGGSEEEGFALETEIGLFAMKRDAVFRTLEPFQRAGIEVDVVQLTPLALYNFVLFDQLTDVPPPAEYDPDNPPESIVVISLGTDATDLVVTNGYRVWQRSVPIGGSHFTKALTKELKLTFAKAEHVKRNTEQLKRNGAAGQDQKVVFQAMRPVFNDLLTELQRSIGYFTSLDRNAKIGRVIAIGNAMKLPGLRRYLSQNLGFEIEKVEEFNKLVGPQVVNAKAFQENVLAFGVCYGLGVQGLARAGLRTNLLPKEIVHDRLVRRKKPWAIAAAAVLLLAFGVSFATFSMALSTVEPTRSVDGVTWKDAESRADTVVANSTRLRGEADTARTQYKNIDETGRHLVGNVEGRLLWLELLKAINNALPAEKGKRPDDIMERVGLHIVNVEVQQVPDLSQWFAGVKPWYQPPPSPAAPAPGGGAAPGAAPAAAGAPGPQGAAAPPGVPPGVPGVPPAPPAGAPGTEPPTEGPTGAGWVIQINGYHFHNKPSFGTEQIGAAYVNNNFIKNLRDNKVMLPALDADGVELVSAKEMGLGYFVIVDPQKIEDVTIPDPNAEAPDAAGPPGVAPGGERRGDPGAVKKIPVKEFDFRIEMCWKPTPAGERHKKKAEAAAAAAAQAQGAPQP